MSERIDVSGCLQRGDFRGALHVGGSGCFVLAAATRYLPNCHHFAAQRTNRFAGFFRPSDVQEPGLLLADSAHVFVVLGSAVHGVFSAAALRLRLPKKLLFSVSVRQRPK